MSPAHWMIASRLTGVSFRMESDFQKRKNECRSDACALYELPHDLKHFSRGLSYAVTDGEPSKWHLTTRMVTSSLKSSPQKSAAEL